MERFQKTGQPVDFKMTFVLKLKVEVSCLILCLFYENLGAIFRATNTSSTAVTSIYCHY